MPLAERGDRLAPPLGDELELAVAVELVAEEVAEAERARPHAPRDLGQRGLVDLEEAELGVGRSEEGGGDAARRGSRPTRLCASRTRGRRISAAIAAVVVFPFVAETSADALRQPRREPVDRAGIELREQLPRHRRSAAGADEPRQPRGAARGRDLEPERHLEHARAERSGRRAGRE